MQFGVVTEELAAAAAALRGDGATVVSSEIELMSSGGGVDRWSAGRAHRAAGAFFALLAESARAAGAGLGELGDRLGAAAGEYDSVEQRVLPAG